MGQTIGALFTLSVYMTEVCRFIATVGAAVIVIAVIHWSFVDEKIPWTLRESLRLVALFALLVAIVGGLLAVVIMARSGS
jgi:hypothetical protein